ncbi:hypothetical protein D3C86_1934800 [compost metagenome]
MALGTLIENAGAHGGALWRSATVRWQLRVVHAKTPFLEPEPENVMSALIQ